MATNTSKTQLGVRLSEHTVRQIDAARNIKPRAEYCRELIERALQGAENPAAWPAEEMREVLDSFAERLSTISHAVTLAQRDAAQGLAEIRRLRADFATAIVGVLTKIGHVVRDDEQHRFARKNAEEFVTRVLLSDVADREDAG